MGALVRFHVQRITTREWLSRDLTISEPTTTRALSTPGGVSGTINPELREQVADDGLRLLEPWGSAIYAEDDGNIRAAGIVTDASFEGPENGITCPGFVTYPTGLLYGSSWPPGGGIQIDPMEAVRHLWEHVQSYPDGDLGMVVDNVKTPVRIGNNKEPYRLRWWESTDCGGEIDQLAQETPFDYDEIHSWADNDKSDVTHRLRIGYPRLGRRRTDQRYVEGENITDVTAVTIEGARYANEATGIGLGSGSQMAYARIAVRDGRLRRNITVTDKTASQRRIETITQQTLHQRREVADISTVQINDHPNAKIAAIQPGDDIYVQVYSPHLEWTRMWVRVLSIAEDADGYSATLSTQRSDSFMYSATTEVSSE